MVNFYWKIAVLLGLLFVVNSQETFESTIAPMKTTTESNVAMTMLEDMNDDEDYEEEAPEDMDEAVVTTTTSPDKEETPPDMTGEENMDELTTMAMLTSTNGMEATSMTKKPTRRISIRRFRAIIRRKPYDGSYGSYRNQLISARQFLTLIGHKLRRAGQAVLRYKSAVYGRSHRYVGVTIIAHGNHVLSDARRLYAVERGHFFSYRNMNHGKVITARGYKLISLGIKLLNYSTILSQRNSGVNSLGLWFDYGKSFADLGKYIVNNAWQLVSHGNRIMMYGNFMRRYRRLPVVNVKPTVYYYYPSRPSYPIRRPNYNTRVIRRPTYQRGPFIKKSKFPKKRVEK